MAASAHCFAVLSSVVFFTFLFMNQVSCDRQTQYRIDYVCRQMEEFGFCNRTFNQNLKAPIADFVDLALITIEQSLLNALNTNTYIERILDGTEAGELKNALNACNDEYIVIIKSFREADRYYKQRDYGEMVKSEFGTPKVIQSCITSFLTPSLQPLNPLETVNRQMRMLCAMALVTGHQLQSSR